MEIDPLIEQIEELSIENTNDLVGVDVVDVSFRGVTPKIDQVLHGYRQKVSLKSGDKVYYHDGIFNKWVDGERKARFWFEKESDGVYALPSPIWDMIHEFFDESLENGEFDVEVWERGRKKDSRTSILSGNNRVYGAGETVSLRGKREGGK